MLSNEVNNELTGKIIDSFFAVYNYFGYGYLERVYENALQYELEVMGLKAEKQKPIKVLCKDRIVGDYYADLFVEDQVIIELKSVIKLTSEHEAQLINYLVATNMQIGLLLNFGPKPEVARKINTFRKR